MTITADDRHHTSGDGPPPAPDLVRAAIELYRTRAFHEVTPQAVADAAGVTGEHLLSLVPSWDDLVVAVVDAWNAERMAPILAVAEERGAVAFLRAIMVANLADPALMRMLSALPNLMAAPDHPIAAPLQRRWLHFHAHVQRTLIRDIAVEREPSTMEPARGAEQLIALYEGLQLHAMVRPWMDLVEAFDRAVARLREGWSHTYRPPLWEI